MATPNEPNWFARNWKWLLPAGCLTLIVVAVLFVGGVSYFVFSMMKSTDSYQAALAAARKNPDVAAALGQPLRDGWFASGHFEESGGSGTAQFSIPVSGPKGSGTIYVDGRKSAGLWKFSTMVLQLDGSGKRIDLLEAPAQPPPAQ